MKMSPEYTKAQERMQPGVITSDGFLGDDTRPIVDIIAADEQTMTKLGLDFETMCSLMHRLIAEGRKGLGEPVTVQNSWVARVDEARGFLASPFDDGIFRKINVELELAPNGKPTGEKILYSELSLHLIEKHHFFQGKGSPFRLDPVQAKKVLRL